MTKMQQAIELYLTGKTYREIAELIGSTPNSVGTILSTARKRGLIPGRESEATTIHVTLSRAAYKRLAEEAFVRGRSVKEFAEKLLGILAREENLISNIVDDGL